MNDCEIGPAKLHRYSPRLTDNEKTGRKDYEGMAHHPSGGYVLYSEHVNILQRLAEQAAEIERLDTECRDRIRQSLENGHNYHAAERAKQDAIDLLRRSLTALKVGECDMHFHDKRGVRRSLQECITFFIDIHGGQS